MFRKAYLFLIAPVVDGAIGWALTGEALLGMVVVLAVGLGNYVFWRRHA